MAPIIVGGGFIITINAGIVVVGNTPTLIPQTVLSLTASASNFIFISSVGVLTINTTGFTSASLPICTIVTNTTGIQTITDNRPDFTLPSPFTSSIFQPWGGLLGGTGVGLLSAANKIQMSGFVLSTAVTFGKIVLSVASLDAGNNYDWGIYDATGVLKAHIGAQTFPSSGVQTFTIVSGPVSLQPAQYFAAFTGNANTAQVSRPGILTSLFGTVLGVTESVTSSSGGVLPNTVTVPSTAWSLSANVHSFVLIT